MSEKLPRWNLPEVDFLATDPQEIKSAIIAEYEKVSGRTLAQGDPVRLYLLSVASIIIELRQAVNHSAQQNLLSYAQGQYLDALGVLLSVERLPASCATTKIKFQLSQELANAFTIPKGFLITNGVVTFATDAALIISAGDTEGVMSAHCTVAGTKGNGYLPGQLATVVSPLTFLECAVNTVETEGGAEIEDDADYAERIRLAPDSFSVAGPVKAYIFHAKSVSSSIVDVSIYSPSPGIVNVYPLLEGGILPGEALLEAVENHLNDETIRPLTDEVHAIAPAAKNYQIKVEYWISKNDSFKSASIQQKVQEAVQKFKTWQQEKIGRDITPSKLVALLVEAGVAVIKDSTFSPASYVEVPKYQVAQCTGVTINYLGLKDE